MRNAFCVGIVGLVLVGNSYRRCPYEFGRTMLRGLIKRFDEIEMTFFKIEITSF